MEDNDTKFVTNFNLPQLSNISKPSPQENIQNSLENYRDMLKDIGKLTWKPTNTPIDPNNKLEVLEEDTPVHKEMHKKLVGRLIYLSHTRPNITSAVCIINQFMHNLKEVHL